MYKPLTYKGCEVPLLLNNSGLFYKIFKIEQVPISYCGKESLWISSFWERDYELDQALVDRKKKEKQIAKKQKNERLKKRGSLAR